MFYKSPRAFTLKIVIHFRTKSNIILSVLIFTALYLSTFTALRTKTQNFVFSYDQINNRYLTGFKIHRNSPFLLYKVLLNLLRVDVKSSGFYFLLLNILLHRGLTPPLNLLRLNYSNSFKGSF